MRITQRQIHAMVHILTTLLGHTKEGEFTVLTITEEGRKDMGILLQEIMNQQSDEVKEIE
jgi:hypothetical protein